MLLADDNDERVAQLEQKRRLRTTCSIVIRQNDISVLCRRRSDILFAAKDYQAGLFLLGSRGRVFGFGFGFLQQNPHQNYCGL